MEYNLNDQLKCLMNRVLVDDPKYLETKYLYYIVWDGKLYKNARTTNIFFVSEKKAINAIITAITSRCWGLFSSNRKEAVDLIRTEVLYLIEKGNIQIKKLILNR